LLDKSISYEHGEQKIIIEQKSRFDINDFFFLFILHFARGKRYSCLAIRREARVQQSGQSELASCAFYFHHLSARSQLTLIRDSENKIRISRQAPHLVMHQKMKKSEYLHSTACDAQSL